MRFIFGLSPMQAHLVDWFQKGEQYEGHWREYTLTELRTMFEPLQIDNIAAENIQSIKPRLSITSIRALYKNLFRVLSLLIPGSRDTNIIIGRKK